MTKQTAFFVLSSEIQSNPRNNGHVHTWKDNPVLHLNMDVIPNNGWSKNLKVVLNFKLHQLLDISLIQRRHWCQNEFHKTPDIDYSTQIHFTDAKWAYRGLLSLISSDRLNLSLSWSITLTRLKCIAAFELKCLWILGNSLSIEWYRGWTCQVHALRTAIHSKHSDTHTDTHKRVLKSETHCSSQAQRDMCNISAKSPGHHTAFTARKSSTHYSSDHKRTPMRERKRQTLRLIYSNLTLFMTAAQQKERPGTSGVILGG